MPPPGGFDPAALYTEAVLRPKFATTELCALLPAEIVAVLRFTSMKPEPVRMVDPELARLEIDLLYRVELAGRETFLFLLLQHPSSPEGLMPDRMVRYMARIWDHWWGWQRDTPKRLPPIVPLVLSNAERPWSAARSLSDKYPEPRSMMAALEQFLRPLHELIALMGSCAERLARTPPERRKTLENMDECELRELRDRHAAMALKMLTVRFGPLADDVRARVAKADLEQLGIYGALLWTADSIEEMFADAAEWPRNLPRRSRARYVDIDMSK
jgi:hypothetical protein